MSSVAVVHPLSLVGKELLDRLEQFPDLSGGVRLFSLVEDEVGTVTEAAGAATFVHRLGAEELDGVDLTFFCGDGASDRPLFSLVPESGRGIVLSRGATAADALPAAIGLNEAAWSANRRLLVPSPAATLLARLAAALAPFDVRSLAATIVEPVSELGREGIDALFEETRALLNMTRPKGTRRFPAQLAFNLLPGRQPIGEIERQTALLLGAAAPRISAQALQGGLFHGVAASVLVELGGDAEAAAIRKALGKDPAFELGRRPEQLGPVAAAGTERIVVGEVSEAGARRCWIWAVIDNLTTGGAIPALQLAQALVGTGRAS